MESDPIDFRDGCRRRFGALPVHLSLSLCARIATCPHALPAITVGRFIRMGDFDTTPDGLSVLGMCIVAASGLLIALKSRKAKV